MTAAQIAATLHLTGLTQRAFGDAIGVSKMSVSNWLSGTYAASANAVANIHRLRAEHDADLARIIQLANDGAPMILGAHARGRDWSIGLAARLIDRLPDAEIVWD
ncbi:helix-turn-helix transcriptional regulator [Leucobacter sp. UT-8R-CII-1-4]|uniref:helix-turn-helix domain-containing protein n=1 Tax=Leucobacter sp. UT-8R-CII-1-4 TaxID=3040075 RepID=UPI0024A9A219|nr:helix-turn-helix transcriptional regulator [Leucobacter sp. UT-8R-CII-1-4]MDI6024452.1 helix-turn-helix transcriptional regulator [Leucobacter sp. UT-8R-CII-1-4]